MSTPAAVRSSSGRLKVWLLCAGEITRVTGGSPEGAASMRCRCGSAGLAPRGSRPGSTRVIERRGYAKDVDHLLGVPEADLRARRVARRAVVDTLRGDDRVEVSAMRAPRAIDGAEFEGLGERAELVRQGTEGAGVPGGDHVPGAEGARHRERRSSSEIVPPRESASSGQFRSIARAAGSTADHDSPVAGRDAASATRGRRTPGRISGWTSA